MGQIVWIGVCFEGSLDECAGRAKLDEFDVEALFVLPTLGANISDNGMEARVDVFDIVFPHDLPLNVCCVLILLSEFRLERKKHGGQRHLLNDALEYSHARASVHGGYREDEHVDEHMEGTEEA